MEILPIDVEVVEVSRNCHSYSHHHRGSKVSLKQLVEQQQKGLLQGQRCSSLSSQILLLKVAEDLMTMAYENGINLFNTAEVYNAGK